MAALAGRLSNNSLKVFGPSFTDFMSELSLLLELDFETGGSEAQAYTFRGSEDIDDDALGVFHGDRGTASPDRRPGTDGCIGAVDVG